MNWVGVYYLWGSCDLGEVSASWAWFLLKIVLRNRWPLISSSEHPSSVQRQKKQFTGTKGMLVVTSSMCCTFNAVFPTWHVLTQFCESSYTIPTFVCLAFVLTFTCLSVWGCLCVWIPTPAGSWGLDSGLAAGIFTCWALLPVLLSLYRRRPHDSARVLLTPGNKVASAPQGRFLTCAVACRRLGDCAQLLWVMLEDVSLLTTRLPGWRPISCEHVLNR